MDNEEQKSDDNGLTLCQILRLAKLKCVHFSIHLDFQPAYVLICVVTNDLAFLAALWTSLKSCPILLSRLVQS